MKRRFQWRSQDFGSGGGERFNLFSNPTLEWPLQGSGGGGPPGFWGSEDVAPGNFFKKYPFIFQLEKIDF